MPRHRAGQQHLHSWRHGQRPVVCRRSRQQSTGVVQEPTVRAACPTRSWHPRRVAARGFPRYSLDEDYVRLPRMAWHVLSRRSRET